jgi:hypothetical protein
MMDTESRGALQTKQQLDQLALQYLHTYGPYGSGSNAEDCIFLRRALGMTEVSSDDEYGADVSASAATATPATTSAPAERGTDGNSMGNSIAPHLISCSQQQQQPEQPPIGCRRSSRFSKGKLPAQPYWAGQVSTPPVAAHATPLQLRKSKHQQNNNSNI